MKDGPLTLSSPFLIADKSIHVKVPLDVTLWQLIRSCEVDGLALFGENSKEEALVVYLALLTQDLTNRLFLCQCRVRKQQQRRPTGGGVLIPVS